jgi:hypothetical protein
MVASALHCGASLATADTTSKPETSKDASGDGAAIEAGPPPTAAASGDSSNAAAATLDGGAPDAKVVNERLARLERLAAEQSKRLDAAKSELKRLRSLSIESNNVDERRDAASKIVAAEQAVNDEEAKKRALDKEVAAERNTSAPLVGGNTPADQTDLEFKYGTRLHYGPTISVLKFNVSRPSNEPGRLRNYSPELAIVPLELGFQFIVEPANRPWRFIRKDGKDFQLMSPGGMLLVRISDKDLAQGEISLAATLSFFNNTIGLGLGFDLYRGIPVLGPDGRPGGSTVYTGILPWAFAKEGEVTPENLFVVLTLGLAPVVRAVTGDVK